MSQFDLPAFEEEAHEKWAHAFESNPSRLEKFYINVAFPYPSGAMHVGHGRTYIVPDVIARFWRMKGKQVLFPMAFHVTGAPVVGISKRIANRDEKTIRLYRDLYRVPQNVLDSFTDPLTIVRHFAAEYQRVMTACGLSIDWRRRFITVDPTYSKFIEWQWKHLYEAGHVIKGAHPVRYCTVDDNPVGDHDLLEGDKAEVIKFTMIMFRYGDAFVPCATLRPETIYGVTNLWANPTVTYVKAIVDGKAWIVSKEAAEKLALQDHKVEIKEEIKGSDLVDKKVSHPLCGEITILPGRVRGPRHGERHGDERPRPRPVRLHRPPRPPAGREIQGHQADPLIKVEGYGEVPAQFAVEKAGIANQMDSRMDALTQEIYSAEFSKGKLFEKYGGKPVRVARDEVAAPHDGEVRLGRHVRVRRPPRGLPVRQQGEGEDPPRPVVPEVQRPRVEAGGQRLPEGHGPRAPRGPGRVRPHGRLAQGLGLHPACRPWHPVPLGHHAADRAPLGLDRLHGVLHDRPQDPGHRLEDSSPPRSSTISSSGRSPRTSPRRRSSMRCGRSSSTGTRTTSGSRQRT